MSIKGFKINGNIEKYDYESLENKPSHIEGNVSIFSGKTASFYGDSLTEANWHYTKGYHQWVKEILGLASYKNYGVSGYKVSDVYNKVNSVSDTSDIIFIMCGVNDQTFSVPLGVMGDTTSDTTYGALNLLCGLLKQKYPTKLVVFITPHYQTNYLHNDGITSYDVSKAIREVCGKYAIPVYDNFVLSGIYTTNLSTFTTDNCHWNDKAHEMVGKNLARFVDNTFGYLCEVEATKTLTSITPMFNQGDNIIYDTASLNSLKQYLTVTANYSDGTSSVVTSYTLTGVLKAGTSVITVAYGDKTATFNVTVTEFQNDGSEWLGKTFTMTAVQNSTSSIFNFTVLLPNASYVSGTKLTANLSISDYVEGSVSAEQWANAGTFYDTTGELGNTKYVGVAVNGYGTTGTTDGNGNMDLAINTTITKSYDGYLKVVIPIKYSGSFPISFVINSLEVKLNDVSAEILKIGTFFNGETCTIT